MSSTYSEAFSVATHSNKKVLLDILCFEMSVINQKEYLKKYLSLGDEKDKSKKRKKRSKILKDRLKIIDDDIDVPHNINENELNEFLTAEDAPQVCGIVDERPLSMRIDDYRKSDKWKLVGSDDELKEIEQKVSKSSDSIKHQKIDSDSDLSPSRNKRLDSDSSPPRKTKSSDKRKSKFTNASPPRRTRRNSESDNSPPRKSKDGSESDNNSPRKSKKRSNSDTPSPSRRPRNSNSNVKRKSRFTDASPPRKTKRSSGSDNSPPRKSKKRSDSAASSPRRARNETNSKENSKLYQRNSDSDVSPPRRRKNTADLNTVFSNNLQSKHNKSSKKMTKTLDGKVAGLQSGKDLKHETAALRQREDDLFKNMSAEISGKNAAPILRDRKTGRKRDLEKEAQEEFEKQQIENAKKEKYDKWGKGLKQVEDHKEKIQEQLHEMAKPLARYADDEDLEKYLKDQDREGDPMLQYIKKKRKDKAIASGDPKSLKPQYDGEFMPNRFGIPPGHRWDGVDRSNGYEKEWFKVQNSKKAVEEEIYKWSTEDM